MELTGFNYEAIIPYSTRDEDKLTRVASDIGNEGNLTDTISTPELPFVMDLQIRLEVNKSPMLQLDEIGKVGYLTLSMTVSRATVNENSLSSLLFSVNNWIKTTLMVHGAGDWIGCIYAVLILYDTTPPITQELLDKQPDLLIRLMPNIIPPTLRLDSRSLPDMISKDFGALKTDSYRFSLYGGLIYNSDYASVRDYIQDYVVPELAKLRTTQAFFEVLNIFLNNQLDAQEDQDLENSYQRMAKLKESSLKTIATTEYSRSFRQLTQISAELTSIFGIDSLRTSLNDKIDVIDSILERIIEARNRKTDERMARTNNLLGLLSLLVALLALPQIYDFLRMLFGR